MILKYINGKNIHERVMKAGYVLRTEPAPMTPDHEHDFNIDPNLWTIAYTPNGDYIGDSETAYFLCVKKGIYPQKIDSEHNTCSIGFSRKDGKWYGWSHRAIYGFKIGSKCKIGDSHYTPIDQGGKGEWVARTVEGAKQMAIDFAQSVS